MRFLEGMSDGGAIVLTFVAVLVAAALGFLFLLLIRRNLKKEKEESEVIVEDAVTRRAMEDSVRNYIKKVDRFGAMTLMYVDIDGFADLNEVFEVADSAIIMYEGKINAYLPDMKKVTEYELGQYMLGLKHQSAKEIGEVKHDEA